MKLLIIIQVLLIYLMVVFVTTTSAGICTKPTVGSPPPPCPLLLKDGNYLPCDHYLSNSTVDLPIGEEEDYHSIYVDPPVSDQDEVPYTLDDFKVNSCITNDLNHVGLQFSWRINNTENLERPTGILIVVNHNDVPSFAHQLNISFVDKTYNSNVSTTCVPFRDDIKNSRRFKIQANLQPGTNVVNYPPPPEKGFLDISINCTNTAKYPNVCAATPSVRPEINVNCNTVRVTLPADGPPGLANHFNYSVDIILIREEDDHQVSQRVTLKNVRPRPLPPEVKFPNVPAGTYNAVFAYLDENDLACEQNYFKSADNIAVAAAPFGKPVMSVNCSTVTVKRPVYGDLTLEYNAKVLLKTKENVIVDSYRDLLRPGPNIPDVVFHNVGTGTYQAEFLYLNDNNSPCEVFRSASHIVKAAPTVKSTFNVDCRTVTVGLGQTALDQPTYNLLKVLLKNENNVAVADRYMLTYSESSTYFPDVVFHDVSAGTYAAEFAYLGENNSICNVSPSETDIIVKVTCPWHLNVAVAVAVVCIIILMVVVILCVRRKRNQDANSCHVEEDSIGGAASLADTTRQEQYMHRHLDFIHRTESHTNATISENQLESGIELDDANTFSV